MIVKKDRRGGSSSRTKGKVMPSYTNTNNGDGYMDAVRKADNGKENLLLEKAGTMKQLSSTVGRMVKRRGRPKGLNDKKKIAIVSECMGEQELSANAETTGLTPQGVMDAISWKDQRNFLCHQCRRAKASVVICSRCKEKHVQRLHCEVVSRQNNRPSRGHMPFLLWELQLRSLPSNRCLLKGLHIQKEQKLELDVEANIRGVQLTEEDVTKSVIDDDDRVYWYGTPNINFLLHYLCSETIDGAPHGATEASSSQASRWKLVCAALNGNNPSDGWRSPETLLPNGCPTHMSFDVSEWRARSDGSIPCPPKECGGCGSSLMALKASLKQIG
ncbi:hypothetical protein HAX54_037097 [Datura stramonium]|uniref:Uncharacterized protein n=1 Tax=Datura stramonium TaxID=4076 RepID=A0ABS8SGP5_DATST|nr:hypothetical protein [Datura stramonium]